MRKVTFAKPPAGGDTTRKMRNVTFMKTDTSKTMYVYKSNEKMKITFV